MIKIFCFELKKSGGNGNLVNTGPIILCVEIAAKESENITDWCVPILNTVEARKTERLKNLHHRSN